MHKPAKADTQPKHASLVISYHFPPILNSSGLLRILSFVRALTEHGTDTTVLSCDIKAYQQTHSQQSTLLPANITLVRCFARHTAQSFSWRGKYLDLLALPDALQSWIVPAIWRGWRLIKQNNINSILSTYPLASAHIVGYALCRLTGVHWVADLRDPMLQPDYPSGRLRRWLFGAIERRIFKYARWITVTTDSTAQLYQQRFAQYADKVITVPNGYDETLEQLAAVDKASSGPVTLLHSGMLNKDDRDPTALLDAVQQLHEAGKLTAANFKLVFRASDQTAMLQQLVQQRQLQALVDIAAALPYQEAIKEMQQASALLLLQGPSCNMQIPVKLYEYLFCRRPLLALCHPDGEVARLCQQLQVGICVAIEDSVAISGAIEQLLHQLAHNSARILTPNQLPQLSRRQHAMRLAELMRPPQRQD